MVRIVPGTCIYMVEYALYILPHLILVAALGGRCYYFAHFNDEELCTEVTQLTSGRARTWTGGAWLQGLGSSILHFKACWFFHKSLLENKDDSHTNNCCSLYAKYFVVHFRCMSENPTLHGIQSPFFRGGSETVKYRNCWKSEAKEWSHDWNPGLSGFPILLFLSIGTSCKAGTLFFPGDSWHLVTSFQTHFVTHGTSWATGWDNDPCFPRPDWGHLLPVKQINLVHESATPRRPAKLDLGFENC